MIKFLSGIGLVFLYFTFFCLFPKFSYAAFSVPSIGNGELIDAYNAALGELIRSNEWHKLYQKYFGLDTDHTRIFNQLEYYKGSGSSNMLSYPTRYASGYDSPTSKNNYIMYDCNTDLQTYPNGKSLSEEGTLYEIIVERSIQIMYNNDSPGFHTPMTCGISHDFFIANRGFEYELIEKIIEHISAYYIGDRRIRTIWTPDKTKTSSTSHCNLSRKNSTTKSYSSYSIPRIVETVSNRRYHIISAGIPNVPDNVPNGNFGCGSILSEVGVMTNDPTLLNDFDTPISLATLKQKIIGKNVCLHENTFSMSMAETIFANVAYNKVVSDSWTLDLIKGREGAWDNFIHKGGCSFIIAESATLIALHKLTVITQREGNTITEGIDNIDRIKYSSTNAKYPYRYIKTLETSLVAVSDLDDSPSIKKTPNNMQRLNGQSQTIQYLPEHLSYLSNTFNIAPVFLPDTRNSYESNPDLMKLVSFSLNKWMDTPLSPTKSAYTKSWQTNFGLENNGGEMIKKKIYLGENEDVYNKLVEELISSSVSMFPPAMETFLNRIINKMSGETGGQAAIQKTSNIILKYGKYSDYFHAIANKLSLSNFNYLAVKMLFVSYVYDKFFDQAVAYMPYGKEEKTLFGYMESIYITKGDMFKTKSKDINQLVRVFRAAMKTIDVVRITGKGVAKELIRLPTISGVVAPMLHYYSGSFGRYYSNFNTKDGKRGDAPLDTIDLLIKDFIGYIGILENNGNPPPSIYNMILALEILKKSTYDFTMPTNVDYAKGCTIEGLNRNLNFVSIGLNTVSGKINVAVNGVVKDKSFVAVSYPSSLNYEDELPAMYKYFSARNNISPIKRSVFLEKLIYSFECSLNDDNRLIDLASFSELFKFSPIRSPYTVGGTYVMYETKNKQVQIISSTEQCSYRYVAVNSLSSNYKALYLKRRKDSVIGANNCSDLVNECGSGGPENCMYNEANLTVDSSIIIPVCLDTKESDGDPPKSLTWLGEVPEKSNSYSTGIFHSIIASRNMDVGITSTQGFHDPVHFNGFDDSAIRAILKTFRDVYGINVVANLIDDRLSDNYRAVSLLKTNSATTTEVDFVLSNMRAKSYAYIDITNPNYISVDKTNNNMFSLNGILYGRNYINTRIGIAMLSTHKCVNKINGVAFTNSLDQCKTTIEASDNEKLKICYVGGSLGSDFISSFTNFGENVSLELYRTLSRAIAELQIMGRGAGKPCDMVIDEETLIRSQIKQYLERYNRMAIGKDTASATVVNKRYFTEALTPVPLVRTTISYPVSIVPLLRKDSDHAAEQADTEIDIAVVFMGSFAFIVLVPIVTLMVLRGLIMKKLSVKFICDKRCSSRSKRRGNVMAKGNNGLRDTRPSIGVVGLGYN